MQGEEEIGGDREQEEHEAHDKKGMKAPSPFGIPLLDRIEDRPLQHLEETGFITGPIR